MGKKLTKRGEDYSKWYNELVIKADLAENSGVRGMMVIKPYGYAIWEKMQAELDPETRAEQSERERQEAEQARLEAEARARASEQAAAIEATSSSLEEISAMTGQNTQRAHQANALMQEARQAVETADCAMAALTRAMDEIS